MSNSHIGIRNAQNRARWRLRYLTGSQCADVYDPIARYFLNARLAEQRLEARKWLAERETLRAKENVVRFRLRAVR